MLPHLTSGSAQPTYYPQSNASQPVAFNSPTTAGNGSHSAASSAASPPMGISGGVPQQQQQQAWMQFQNSAASAAAPFGPQHANQSPPFVGASTPYAPATFALHHHHHHQHIQQQQQHTFVALPRATGGFGDVGTHAAAALMSMSSASMSIGAPSTTDGNPFNASGGPTALQHYQQAAAAVGGRPLSQSTAHVTSPNVATHDPLIVMHPVSSNTPTTHSRQTPNTTHTNTTSSATPKQQHHATGAAASGERDAADIAKTLAWGVQRLADALAAMTSESDPLPVRVLQEFRELCDSKKATDGDMYAALRSMPEAAFDAFLTLYQRSPLPRCLLDDLTESRGILWLSVFDACCCPFIISSSSSSNTVECASATAMGLEMLKPICDLVAVLSISQRGCIALMRVVSCVHHDPALLGTVVRHVLTPHAGPLLANERASYVLCHAINGLAPSPIGASDGAVMAEMGSRFGPAAATGVQDRAAYIFDISSWAAAGPSDSGTATAAAAAAPSSAPSPPSGKTAPEVFETPRSRAMCEVAAWDTFVAAVCAELVKQCDTVLRGRQQCFVLWHVLRRWPMLSIPAAVDVLATYTSPRPTVPWPPPPVPSSSGNGGGGGAPLLPNAGSGRGGGSGFFSASSDRLAASFSSSIDSMGASSLMLLSGGGAAGSTSSPSQSLVTHTPLNTLCRSTPGRCALAALIASASDALETDAHHGAAAASAVGDEHRAAAARMVVDAVRLLSAGGLPAVDKKLEATMKRRPGMEAARSVEQLVDQLLRLDAAARKVA